MLGWAAATGVSDRCVYAGVVEHSVYVDPAGRWAGRGARVAPGARRVDGSGGHLDDPVRHLPREPPSLRLHERAGFRIVGTRQRVGRMTYGPLAGQWRDVVFVERRSSLAGT